MNPTPVIRCCDLSKSFMTDGKESCALSNLSFELEAGKITGLLGPDGSGKTTLLRLMTGLYRPSVGKLEVLGLDSVKDAAKIQSTVGYMPQKFGLYEDLTVAENLSLYADLHAIPADDQKTRFKELLQLTDLAQFTGRMAGKLSGGMKQKLALACTLVSHPPLLLLDEPTVGVDVLSRRELWHILRELADREQMSVIVSTAYLDEADYCDHTLILFNGRLSADGTASEIAHKAIGKIEKPCFEDGFMFSLYGDVPPKLKRKGKPQTDAPVMVRVNNLTKRFGDFTAVDNISFEVHKGEIFGLLGANGAGKSTTFRMLCGLTGVDGGTLEVAGCNLRHSPVAARRRLGFVAQKFSLYTDLNVMDNLEFFGGAYGLHGRKLSDRIKWALESFSLKDFSTVSTAKLPLGYKRRLSMACALLHEPDILFLDEATSGADPMARREFWARIIDLADSGVTVIITTHFLDEAEYCDRMVIMMDGMIPAAGTPDEIRKLGVTPENKNPTLEDAFVNVIKDFRKSGSAK